MAKNIGYENALNLAWDELKDKDPAKVVENTGVQWNGEEYVMPWLGKEIPLSEGSEEQRIIWMHYMLGEGPKQPRGNYITFKQAPGAAIYDANHTKRCINPMVKTFAEDLDAFRAIGKEMGGEETKLGHAAITLHPVPYAPLTLVLWQGDDEIPSSGNVLYDEGAIDWFCAEDLVVYASLPVYAMIKEYYARKNNQ